MATFRTIKERGDFVTVNKMFIFDERLSAKAKGILLYFLSRPNDWQIYTSEVVKHMNDGQKSINNGIKELMECKYVHRIQKRKDSGVFSGYEYHVYERPTEMPLSENGLSENGKTENRKGQTTNNNITNNDLTNNDINTIATKVTQERFDQWWNLYDKKLDKKKAFSLFKSALKKHDFETIMNGTKAYKQTITNKQYQKYPKTFLSQESYMNDYSEEISKTAEENNNSDYLSQLLNEEA
ncbi:helix-turn-helix domain-containing protein [Staphylococcus pettenkoferi]|uniref:helix-turn-helix domain-containing protein n=1 Tax=Staphylococcus pettenkoferi TaxID=170573 RepID=UPI002272D94B|nr:helix-turn-helix domain-containing protein [Staphylococcus pettenkoferi]MCY1565543.1 helix-turn-helix domain-containing protein [Staphylococcus pettenkoferi]